LVFEILTALVLCFGRLLWPYTAAALTGLFDFMIFLFYGNHSSKAHRFRAKDRRTDTNCFSLLTTDFLIAPALFSGLLINIIQKLAIRRPCIWRDEFARKIYRCNF